MVGPAGGVPDVAVTVELLLFVCGSLVPAGAATVAVLTRSPVADACTVPVTVKTTVLPAPVGMLTVAASVLPEPLPPLVTEAVPVVLEVQLTPVRFVGMLSDTP